MKDGFDLKDRKRDLLLHCVESYIENALPITSQKVHTDSFSSLSPATLRNELNALEEMGFLKQLHTSGGRVPTTRAYRYFVDWLMNNNVLDITQVDEVRDKFVTRSAFLQDMLTDLAKAISEITNYPTVIAMGGYKELVLKEINVIPLITGQGLVLIKTDAGIISNSIKLNSDITEENCKDASKFLTTSFYDKKIADIVNNIGFYDAMFKAQIRYYQELFTALVDVLKEYAKQTSIVKSANPQLVLNTTSETNMDSAKKLINILENEKEIQKIIENIDDNSANDLVFAIGDENSNEDLNDFSIIKANYKLSNNLVTSIGVIGPKRLDYAKIASALKYIIDEQNKDVSREVKGGKNGRGKKEKETTGK